MAVLGGKRFGNPDEVRECTDDKGRVELVDLNGHTIGLGTFEPGWRSSENVKPIVGTDSFYVSPRHDAWIVGDERCVLLDSGSLKGYAS